MNCSIEQAWVFSTAKSILLRRFAFDSANAISCRETVDIDGCWLTASSTFITWATSSA